jgi:CRP-like cAMP-binding protein
LCASSATIVAAPAGQWLSIQICGGDVKNQDIVNELAGVLIFQRLAPEQLERVAEKAVRVRLSENDSLFQQQDPAKRFYLLSSGQMKLYRLGREGNEKVIEIINPGDTFAEALMFLQNPSYPVNAQAIKTSELISIDAADFVSILSESTGTLLLLAADLSQRLHGMVGELNDLSLHSGTCRVANFFIHHMDDEVNEFELSLPKQVLASRLSIKPETLSRIFRRMTNAGLISIESNRIKVLDRTQLLDLATVYPIGTNPGEPSVH